MTELLVLVKVLALLLLCFQCPARHTVPDVSSAQRSLSHIDAVPASVPGLQPIVLSTEQQKNAAELKQQQFCNATRDVSVQGIQTIRISNLFSMCVYQQDDLMSRHFRLKGQWERVGLERILWALQEPLPPNVHRHSTTASVPLFVDAGANLGWFTLNVAVRGYRVAAFEAMESNQELIRSSLCLQPHLMARVTLYPFGLAAQKDQCYIVSEDQNLSDGIIKCGHASLEEARKHLRRREYQVRGSVNLERLDGVLQEDVKVLKVDVEGYEPFVLEGGIDLFTNFKVWYISIELNVVLLRTSLRRVGREPYYLLQVLIKYGYEISRVSFQGPWLSEDELQALVATRNLVANLYCRLKELSEMGGGTAGQAPAAGDVQRQLPRNNGS